MSKGLSKCAILAAGPFVFSFSNIIVVGNLSVEPACVPSEMVGKLYTFESSENLSSGK